jgi:hypothetical protein
MAFNPVLAKDTIYRNAVRAVHVFGRRGASVSPNSGLTISDSRPP